MQNDQDVRVNVTLADLYVLTSSVYELWGSHNACMLQFLALPFCIRFIVFVED